MTRYRKKPIEIEAVQFTGDNEYEIAKFMGIPVAGLQMSMDAVLRADGDYRENTHIHINTLEGLMTVNCGDYIIKGVKGEFYPCKPDIFNETYEKVKKMTELKCSKCEAEMVQGAYTVDPPIPYAGCPKCGYRKKRNNISHACDGEGAMSASSTWISDNLGHNTTVINPNVAKPNVASSTWISDNLGHCTGTVIDPTVIKVNALIERVDELEKKVAKLDADLYRKEIALKWAIADLKPSAGRRIPYFMPKDAFDRLSDDVKRKMTPCPGRIDLTDEEYEEAVKAAISKAKGEPTTSDKV